MKKLNIVDKLILEVNIDKNGLPITINVGPQLIEILKIPPERGASYEYEAEIVPLIRKIKTAIKAEEPYVLLEKDEHTALSSAVKKFNFPFIDPALFDWRKSILELPDVAVTIKEEPKDQAEPAAEVGPA